MTTDPLPREPMPVPAAARSRRFDHLSAPEARHQARRPGCTLVWPFGAIEQHGPHLPLATDGLFAERILDAVLAELDPDGPLWRLPLQSLGFSPEHGGFGGTLSLPAELILELVAAVGHSLAALGVRRLLLFNGHGGQIALLEVAARRLRAEAPGLAVLPCFLWRGADGLDALIPEPERSQGLHAGLAETSLMLHQAPALVGVVPPADGLVAQAEAPPGWSLEGALPCAWLTADLSTSGVIGDPGGAEATLGRQLERRLVRGWSQRLEALMLSDWPPQSPGV
ncbi:MAG: creatininase family protein [Cyanobacteriota bacterium]|nr:creatininase family protein [Cyanobacteriota bacterium]